jgi:uncharacterized membrane protein
MKTTIDINTLLNAETEHLKKLENIVNQTIAKEELIINNLLHPPIAKTKRADAISDKVAKFGGSWSFILSFFAVLLVWIVYNTISYKLAQFDPYPFILMNLILSCIAALQAPIIMMSQNRQEIKDRKRSENDYLINLKAEIEVRTLHQKMDFLLNDQFKMLLQSQVKQLELLKALEGKIKN